MTPTRSTNTGQRSGTSTLIETLLHHNSYQSVWMNTTEHDWMNILMVLWEGLSMQMNGHRNQTQSKDGQCEVSGLRMIKIFGLIHIALQHVNHSLMQNSEDVRNVNPNNVLLSIESSSVEPSSSSDDSSYPTEGQHEKHQSSRNFFTRFVSPQHPTDKIKVSQIISSVDSKEFCPFGRGNICTISSGISLQGWSQIV